MRNPIQKCLQNSIVFEKPGFLFEKLKALASSNFHRVQQFLLKPRTRFLLTNVYKSVFGIFLFFLYLELFAKTKQDLVSTYSLFTYFLITQDLNKKNPEHPFVDIIKQEPCAKCQQKILNFVVVGARQSFQFFREIVWFLGNNRAFSKFRCQILHSLISITKL